MTDELIKHLIADVVINDRSYIGAERILRELELQGKLQRGSVNSIEFANHIHLQRLHVTKVSLYFSPVDIFVPVGHGFHLATHFRNIFILEVVDPCYSVHVQMP